MKVKILLLLFTLFFSVSYAQDFMDNIATKACECITALPDSLNNE